MEIGKIICYGCSHPKTGWKHQNLIGVNRLYYIYGGTGGCRHNGREYEFQPDTLYFIPYAADFQLRTDEQDPVLHAYMDFELFPPVMTRELLITAPTGDSLMVSALEVFRTGAEWVTKRNLCMEQLRSQQAMNLLCTGAVIYLVNRIVEVNQVPLLKDLTVLQALETIHRRMDEPLKVEQLAKESFMNTDSFIRRFSSAMGVTPYAYLKRLRLNTARLLRQEGWNLTAIAKQTGYSDASALLHALKKTEKTGK